jgi:carbonic anhydrase
MKLFLRIILFGLLGALMAALGTLAAVKWGQAAHHRSEAEKLAEIVATQRDRISALETDVEALETTARNREARLRALEKAGGGLVAVAGTDTQQACQLARDTPLTAQPAKADVRPAALEPRYRQGPLRVAHTGQSIRLYPAPGGVLKVGGETAELINVDVHQPPQGLFAGMAAALVAQFVHRTQDGKLIAVSVPLRESAFQNRTLWTMAQHVPAAGAAPAEVGTVSVDPASLLPENLGYDLYTGVLPVPPCSGGVSFYRLRSPVGLSREQVAKLRALLAGTPANPPAAAAVPAAAPAAHGKTAQR